MLDSKSLDVISKFKLVLLTQAQQQQVQPPALPISNRGKKLPPIGTKSHQLTPKVVEYGGLNHLVLTNDVIERSNYRNKRRWLDFYLSQNGRDDRAVASELETDTDSEGGSDAENDDENESPFKRLRVSEILAPLAHPLELVTHPAISKTYKSTCLSTLALDLINLIEIEQGTLNHLNKLLQVLDGEDWYYLLEENMGLPVYDHGLDETITAAQKKKTEDENSKEKGEQLSLATSGAAAAADVDENKRITRLTTATTEGPVQVTDPFFALPETLARYEAIQESQLEENEGEEDELESVQQDLVNYLQVSIQRQFEYIKNLTTLRNGIVKVDRYKGDLLKWGKEMNEKKN